MLPTDCVSGTIPPLWSTLPTDCASGHNTTALDDVADLTALRTNTSALVSMLPTDRASGHDTSALDDVADLTA